MAVGTLLSLLAVAYWIVQIVRGEYYFSLSENNRIRAVKITAPRGYVLDRNGATLVENEPAYTLHLYRREAKDLEASVGFHRGPARPEPRAGALARRARRAGTPSSSRSRSPRTSGIEEVAAVEARAAEHPEFAITVSQRRLYKHGGAAAHALGYLSEATPEQIKNAGNVYGVGDWIGQKGIESAYERLLSGANGERRVIVDSHGREVAEEARLEATPGPEPLPDARPEAAGRRRGVLPRQGRLRRRARSADRRDPRARVLALVRPELVHAPRDRRPEWSGLLENPDRPLQNRAIQNMYSPGSVIKPFIAYGALARGTRGSRKRGSSARATRCSTGASSTATRRAATAWSTCATRSRCPATSTSTTSASARHRPHQRDPDVVRLRRADRRRPLVREVGPRAVGGVGAHAARRALVSERDDLGLDRPGAAARDVDAGRARARGPARGRAAADAAPLLLLAGPAHGSAAALQGRVSRRRSRSRRRSSPSSRTACGRS